MSMASHGQPQSAIAGAPLGAQTQKPKLPHKPKIDSGILGRVAMNIQSTEQTQSTTECSRVHMYHRDEAAHRHPGTDTSNSCLPSNGGHSGSPVHNGPQDRSKSGVSNLRDKFESRTGSRDSSPVNKGQIRSGGEHVVPNVTIANRKPTTVLQPGLDTERRCVRPPCLPPPSPEQSTPTITSTLKHPDPCPQTCKAPFYINRYVETSPAPPELLPRKTQKSSTTVIAPNDISAEDQKCLLKKVPAPAPRISKITPGSNPVARTGFMMPQGHPKHDRNFNRHDILDEYNRDSTGSNKSQDSGVGSSSPLDDGYFELNDEQIKYTKHTNQIKSPEKVICADSRPRHVNLKSPVPANSQPHDPKTDDDGYERVDGPHCHTNSTVNNVIPDEPCPSLPEKRKQKYTKSSAQAVTKELKHSVPVSVPKQADTTTSLTLSHSKSEPNLEGHSPKLSRLTRKPTLDVPPEFFSSSAAPPLPPRSPTTRRRELSPSVTSRHLSSDHMNPDTVVPPPTRSPITEKSTDKVTVSKRNNRLAMEVPAPRGPTAKGPSGFSSELASPMSSSASMIDDIPTVAPPPPPCVPRPMTSLKSPGNYISPDDLDSVPDKPVSALCSYLKSPVVITPDNTRSTGTKPGAHNSYLQLAGDDDDFDESCVGPEDQDYYSFLDMEPLYQMYNRDVINREIVHQSGDVPGNTAACHNDDADDDDDDDDYMYMDAASCQLLVSDILSRDILPASDYDDEIHTKSLSLQDVCKLGAGTRTLWCEMPQVKDSTILDQMSTEDKKLQEALFEVIRSEASYVKSINLLVTHFFSAPELDPEKLRFSVISKRHHHCLFSNIVQVQKVCQKFLQKLESLWHADCVLNPTDMANTIAEYVTKHFKAYVVYCTNMVYQERTLKELKSESGEFVQLIERLQDCDCVQGLSLQSFLILPMQRITRLPLLVDNICHRMLAGEPGYDALTDALHVLQKIVRQCNEGARQLDNIEKVAEIDSMLDFKNVKKIPIISQHRSVVKQGQLTRILSQSPGLFSKKKMILYFFLFNDLLVITKKKSHNSYQVIEHAPRIAIHADLLSDEDAAKLLPSGIPSGCPHLFIMALMEKDVRFYLSCSSMSERTRWVEAVTPAQQVNEEEKIYDDWDCPQFQCIQRYAAQQPDELSLEESDIINVYRQMSDGWYQGERIRDGEKGWFPSSVTKEIQSAHVRAKNLRQYYRLMNGVSSSSTMKQ